MYGGKNQEMNLFACPICMTQLYNSGGAMICKEAHSFDISREGYVNLLPAHHRKTAAPGDEPGMVQARRRFMEKGHYSPLVMALREQIAAVGKSDSLVDLGCGEGFFTNAFTSEIPQVYGIDVSKAAIKTASKRYKSLKLAVGNTTKLPILDNTFEIATLILAPFSSDIERIIHLGGRMLRVSPGPNHLRELKQLVYRNFQSHKRAILEIPNLKHISQRRIEFDLQLDKQSRIDLIDMTPMKYRVEPAMKSQAISSDQMMIASDFWIDTFEKVQ